MCVNEFSSGLSYDGSIRLRWWWSMTHLFAVCCRRGGNDAGSHLYLTEYMTVETFLPEAAMTTIFGLKAAHTQQTGA